MKPLGKVKIEWSPEFAYAIGLIVTDGCLSKDGRHIDLTSKDKDQIENFLSCLKINNKISTKSSGSSSKRYFAVQFGDVIFYRFLQQIGLDKAKTKTINKVNVPNKYFFDFLRGHFDGDGTFYSYWDKRWKSSYMFYTVFISASEKHINWLQNQIFKKIKIKGHITKGNVYQLKFAKEESFKILSKLYYSENVMCLKRKRLKIEKALNIIGVELN